MEAGAQGLEKSVVNLFIESGAVCVGVGRIHERTYPVITMSWALKERNLRRTKKN